MREMLTALISNLPLVLAFVSWLTAQIAKVLVVLVVERRLNWKYILSSGGMPSSHSSTACALATSIGVLYGMDSPWFSIAVILALVVMYDAFNVRRETGEQAKVLNYMMDHWEKSGPEDPFEKELKELIGHTPLQVAIGAVLGAAIGAAGAMLWG